MCSVTKRIVCRTTPLTAVLELVGLGPGISLLPEMCASADRSKARQYHHLDDAGLTREIAVAFRTDATLSRLSRALIDMLGEDIAGGRHQHGDH